MNIATLHIFHHEVTLPVLDPKIVNTHDVRVVQFRHGPGLTAEAIQRLRIISSLRRQDLDGHHPIEIFLATFIYGSHSS